MPYYSSMKKLIAIFFLFHFSILANAQGCITLGQTPQTAFPVCASDTFYQKSVPICTNNIIKTICNDGAAYGDKNPYWYKFTCFQTGTLGFQIKPNTSSDDYDWELYDVIGLSDYSVLYSNLKYTVCANWSSNPDTTGTSANGTITFGCAGPTFSNQCSLPTVIQGHTYLLMVSHFTDTQDGYKLYFKSGTAIITDPGLPDYIRASGICGADKIYVKLSKQIKCNTIASDGSDFNLSPANVSISKATGDGCTNSFDTDSIIIQLNNPLPPANYTITQLTGTDGNTLLDNCSNAVPVGRTASFVITSQQLIKVGFSYQINYGCKQDTASFTLSGINVSSWIWYFDNGNTSTLQNPIYYYKDFGNKTVKLVGYNSVCTDSISVSFNLLNQPLHAAFTAPDFSCPNDTVSFQNNSTGNIKQWYWDFGNSQISNLQNPPAQQYPANSNIKYFPIRLTITDSIGCTDDAYHLIQVAKSCYIAVPSAFTPNGDVKNDYLYPLNAYNATNLDFKVYNRYGQLVFETKDWTKKWDGTINGVPQASGVYVWMLEYTDKDSGKHLFQKGTTVLIR